jgi:hypothetical protein
MNIFVARFKSLNGWACALIILIMSYLAVLPLTLATYIFPALELGENGALALSSSVVSKVISAVFIAPILETFLYLWLPVKIFSEKLKMKWLYVIVISIFTFSLSHPYSIGYLIFSAIIGAVNIYFYILLIDTTKNNNLVLAGAHAARNLIAFLL